MIDLPERKRGWPFALIAWAAAALAVLAAASWATATGALTWMMAVDALSGVKALVASNVALAYAAYLALFVLMALALFPAQLWVIVFWALVVGFWPALVASWIAATLSAGAVFLAARGVLAGQYRAKAARYLARIEASFRRDQFAWMLAVRLVPVVPYFVSNLAPAFLGARLAPFIAAAAIGVIPYVAAYTFAGAKAASVLDRDTPPDVTSFAADMFPIMLAVAALPMLALAVKRFGRRAP